MAADTAAMAAESMMPSSPMLITAERSLITPHMAANAMGVARTTEVFNIPTRSMDLPAVAQSRNAATKQNATTPTSTSIGANPTRQLPGTQENGHQGQDIDGRLDRQGQLRNGDYVAYPPWVSKYM